MTGGGVDDLLDTICELRGLTGRQAVLHAPLDDGERARLATLAELLGEPAPERTPPRRWRRIDVALPATVEVGNRAATVVVSNVGAGGVYARRATDPLFATTPLAAGQRTILTVREGTRAFLFPARVAWRDPDGGLGLEFIGIPMATRFTPKAESRI